MKKMFTIIGLFYSLPAFAEATKKQCYKIIPVEQASLFPPDEIMCFRNIGSNTGKAFPYTHGEFSFFKVNEIDSTAELVLSSTIPYLASGSTPPGSFQNLYGLGPSKLTWVKNYSFIEFSGNNISTYLFVGQAINQIRVGQEYKCSMLEDELYIKYKLSDYKTTRQ